MLRRPPISTHTDTLIPDTTLFRSTHRGAVTLITLNRPQALNALNVQVLSDLIEAFAAYDKDDSQRCAVITRSEKAFAAGADIKEMADKIGRASCRERECQFV